MQSLSADQQTRAIVAHSMMGGDLPEGRRHFADNLHLGGAYQDNRIIPYEGVQGAALSAAAPGVGPPRRGHDRNTGSTGSSSYALAIRKVQWRSPRPASSADDP